MSEEADTSSLRPVSKPLRFVTIRVIVALILREMSATYGRSPGGYFWAIGEPVLGIGLLSAIFSLGFRNPALGTNFPIFYATGLLPFFMFMDLSIKVSQSINYSRQLLGYTRVTFLDAILARIILSTLTQLLVGGIVFTGIILMFDTRSVLNVPGALLAYFMAIATAISIGTLNAVIMSMFPLWQRVWSVITRPLVLISGVIFIHDNVPLPYSDYLWYNPLVHVVGAMRRSFYYSYEAEYVSATYVFGLSLIVGATGLLFLRRFYRDITEL